MIQDIAPHIYHNQFHPVPPSQDSFVLGFDKDQVLLRKDRKFFEYKDLPQERKCIWLFSIDNRNFYISDLNDLDALRINRYELRFFDDQTMAFAAITAWQLYEWMKENQYCGRCGKPLILYGKERAMYCPHCGNIIYPRINPAAIIAILNDQGQLLVTKYAGGPYKRYALVAGYAEIGETIEECVKREAKEETGLDVTDLVYYKSQPWSFSQSLLFGFWCHAHGNQKIIVQRSELALAEWKNPEDEITVAGHAAMTAEMIHLFQKGETEKWTSIR